MKKLPYILASALLILSFFTQAASKVAVVNVQNVLQQLPQRAAIEKKLKDEFAKRATDLQKEDQSLQEKAQKFERDRTVMKASEVERAREDMLKESQALLTKKQALDLDVYRRQTEESNKIRDSIWEASKKVADSKGYDIVVDSNSVIYLANEKDDITADVSKQVKQAK